MKKGFTMIELIFVIVILGILAAVAIPKLAATRDDAKAASVKTDIGTVLNAIPSWYQGQKEASVVNAMSIDTNVWKKTANIVEYVYKENTTDSDHVTIRIVDANSSDNAKTATAVSATDPVPSNHSWTYEPWLVLDINGSGNNGIVKSLVNSLGVSGTQVSLGGKKVQW